MRIISDFFDYYDPIQRLGQDQSVLFIRKRTEKHVRSTIYLSYPYGSAGVVAFCGRLFPFISISNFADGEYTTEYHYSPEKIKVKDVYQRQSIHRFFNEPQAYVLREYMDKHPVVVAHKGNREDLIVINDNLSKIGFQKVVDPYTAFTQIHSFLSNIAQPRKSIPTISDEDKIQSHGFDKFSFRKDPTKKKK